MSIDRREFIGASSATLLAAAAPRVLGANDRMRIGVIGAGIRGLELLQNLHAEPAVEVVAVSDLYDGHLARAAELSRGVTLPQLTKNYHAVLSRDDVDAIVCAVPDFWHKRVVLDTLAAGKAMYCEKPLIHRLEDGPELIEAVRSAGVVFQVGSQHVSSPHVIEAKQRIAAGELGEITQIKTTWDTNTPIAAWQYPLPTDASERTIAWDAWQQQANQKYPFDARRFFSWRRYREYGESLAGDVLVHMITTVHYLMNSAGAPPVVMATGGSYRWKDGRDIYDAISALGRYPEGFFANYEANQNNQYFGEHIFLLGSKATMDLTFAGYTIYEEDWPLRWSYAVESWSAPQRSAFYAKNGGAPDPTDATRRPRRRK